MRIRTISGLLLTLAFATAARAAELELPLAAVSPAPGAANVAPDAPLKITLDQPPAPKGKLHITDARTREVVETIDLAAEKVNRTIGGIPNFNTRPTLVEGKTLHVFPTKRLDYGATYFITTDPAAISAGPDTFTLNAPTRWQFSTKKAPPAQGAPRLTVAQDHSGDFATLQAALDFLPEGNTTPTTIFVKKGTYREIVAFTGKHNVTLQGEDRKATILAFANNANFNNPGSPYRRGLFLAHRCNDLVLTNMTFHNTTPRGGSQAEAVILAGTPASRAILTGLDLVSFQDTLQINGQAYIQNCYIEGDVDFLWGSGPCFFQDVQCKSTRARAYFTQIRNPETNRGYVFNKCTFTGDPGATENVLARIDPARFPHSEVVLIDCVMTDVVSPAAWRLDNVQGPAADAATRYPNIHFWEFNSRTPDGKPVDVSQRHPVSRQLRELEDKDLIANYRNATWVLGNEWVPKVPDAPGK